MQEAEDELTICIQGPGREISLLAALGSAIASFRYDRLSVCAAYATKWGVLDLRNVLSPVQGGQYRWLLGLDDCFTTPAALKAGRGCQNSEVRVVRSEIGRFHAKAYLLDGGPCDHPTLIIGSANATRDALQRNCEAFVVHRPTTTHASDACVAFWDELWALGSCLSNEVLHEYERDYAESRSKRPELPPEDGDLEDVSAQENVGIGSSRRAWIELGKNTGGGNQLDIVKALAPFLGLADDPAEGDSVLLPFDGPKGRLRYRLTFTQAMWRFMNLQQGFRTKLRPDLDERSPYMLVVEKTQQQVAVLSILHINDAAAQEIIEESRELRLVRTSQPHGRGRRFGWL